MNALEETKPIEAERQFLESMRGQFERQGFQFIVQPNDNDLPNFLGTYRPDAIALKSDEKIAIELKQRPTGSGDVEIRNLRRLFAGHPEWSFSVYYTGGPAADFLRIAPAPISDLRSQVARVEHLRSLGEHRAAFVMAWSLLEGALRAVSFETTGRALTPGTVVQSLVMGGYISEEEGRQLRALIDLRNLTVHGDLSVDVNAGHVVAVANAVKKVLAFQD